MSREQVAELGTASMWPPDGGVGLAGSRYFVLPLLFLVTALAIGLGARLDAGPATGPHGWLVLPAVWFGTLVLLNYSMPNPRSFPPDWTTSLHQARSACPPAPDARVRVPIAPFGHRRPL